MTVEQLLDGFKAERQEFLEALENARKTGDETQYVYQDVRDHFLGYLTQMGFRDLYGSLVKRVIE